LNVFIDSNIPMYVAGGEHEYRAPARQFLERVQKGEVQACTSAEVLQEILHRYSSLGKPALAAEVYDLTVEICPVVLDVTLADIDRARDLLTSIKGISSRDAVHSAVMLNHEVEWIATFDQGFDRVKGIRRLKIQH